MLTIKKRKFSLTLPQLSLGTKPVELSPVIADDDELTRDIASDPDVHDDNWELSERPDGQQLETFWNSVEQDIARDPTWFRFEQ